MHKISIRFVIVVMTLTVTLTTLLIYNGVFGTLVGETFTQMDLKLVTQSVSRAKEQLDVLVLDAQGLSDYIAHVVLTQANFVPGEFAEQVNPLVETGNAVSSVALYSSAGMPVCASSAGKSGPFLTAQSVQEQDWFDMALHGEGPIFSGARMERSYRGDYSWVATMTQRAAYTDADGGLSTGVLAVNIRLSAIEEICKEYSGQECGSLVLTDLAGRIVYSPRAKLEALPGASDVFRSVGSRQEGQQQLELSQPLENEQWILVGLTREGELSQGGQALQRKGLTVLLFSMLFAALLAAMVATWICRPFRYMERAMHRIDAGVSGVRLENHGYREFVSLTRTYNGMIDRIEQLMQESERKQEQLRKMEIASLEEQINPHFLYNALDSITWLVETGRSKDAVSTIGALARLLRLSINRGGNFHTVAREVDHIHNYLIIQKTRYGQRFASHIHVEKEAEALYCPRLILQPIVENAIKHGVAENEDCQIVVRVFLEEERLKITVWDDGMGMLPDKLEEVQRALRENQPPNPEQISGLALKSINRRIRLLCGEQFGITIDSEMEEWTCVTIELPCLPSA